MFYTSAAVAALVKRRALIHKRIYVLMQKIKNTLGKDTFTWSKL